MIVDYKLGSESMEDHAVSLALGSHRFLLVCPEAMCAHLGEMQDVTVGIVKLWEPSFQVYLTAKLSKSTVLRRARSMAARDALWDFVTHAQSVYFLLAFQRQKRGTGDDRGYNVKSYCILVIYSLLWPFDLLLKTED